MPPLNTFSKTTIALALSQAVALPLYAATITVNSTSDTPAANICTLRSAINAANTDEAAQRWKKIGDRSDDNGVSYYKVAHLYRDGLGVNKDRLQEISWLQRSAKKGYVPAMHELGEIYMWGEPDIKNLNFALYSS